MFDSIDWMFIADAIGITVLVCLALGSLLNLSSHPHWFVRGWDFPRVQIMVIAIVVTLVMLVYRAALSDGELVVFDRPMLAAIGLAAAISVWHLYRIAPYTPLATVQSLATDDADIRTQSSDGTDSPDKDEFKRPSRSIRLVVSNVLMENDDRGKWLRVIGGADADVILALETDQTWIDDIAVLLETHPHHVIVPQDNYYGMALYSRLPLCQSQVRYLIESDIPSIDTMVQMRCGTLVRVIGVHPRPPEPIRDTDSTARDAELILWGRELADESRPVVIGGDLNDVAWSRTTRLFLKLCGLCDPRRGRGFYSTFHASHSWFRFPLDHVFHSTHFHIRHLTRLPHVGSDHFPILIDLMCVADGEPPATGEADGMPEMTAEDHQDAEEILRRAIEDDDIDSPALRDGEIGDG